MGQPTPPGDIPLYADLGTEWNEILSGFPEDKRAEFAPKIHERIKSYEPLKQYEDFHRSGIGSEQIATSLHVLNSIENNPREVYETIGKHLGITPQQAKEVVEDLEDNANSDNPDPRYEALQQQLNTMAQILLAERQSKENASAAAEQDKKLEEEINAVKKEFGDDIPEDEILMRMLHKNMSAKEAYQEYAERVATIQRRRPSPFVLGSGGTVPRQPIDVKALSGPETKDMVAQMLMHANREKQS